MTETEKKALALLNECAGQEVHGGWKTFDPNLTPYTRALIRAIEQHEAFRQEVSDAVHKHWGDMPCEFDRFIIAKPDPLVEVCREIGLAPYRPNELRAAIEKRGGKIIFNEEQK